MYWLGLVVFTALIFVYFCNNKKHNYSIVKGLFCMSVESFCLVKRKMPTKIFVGRLAEGTTSDDIGSLFRKFGHVTECDVISNYGFVVRVLPSVSYFTVALFLLRHKHLRKEVREFILHISAIVNFTFFFLP